MKKRKLMLLLTLAVVSLTLSTVALAILYYEMPMTGEVVAMTGEFYVDGELWVSGAQINWGNLLAGQAYTKTLDILNTGDVTFTVGTSIENLPSDWTLVYDKEGDSVLPNEQLDGILTLTPASNAAEGTYDWIFRIHLTEV